MRGAKLKWWRAGGFLIENGGAFFGRPAGVAQAPYGSLFVADDTNGVIYRISWAGRR